MPLCNTNNLGQLFKVQGLDLSILLTTVPYIMRKAQSSPYLLVYIMQHSNKARIFSQNFTFSSACIAMYGLEEL